MDLLPTILSYSSTKNSTQLVKTCIDFSLPLILLDLSSHETKPRMILEKLHHFKKPAIWIEPHFYFLKNPSIFAELGCDIALLFEEREKTASSPLFFNFTASALDLLSHWHFYCLENPLEEDHLLLEKILFSKKHSVRLLPFPVSYISREH